MSYCYRLPLAQPFSCFNFSSPRAGCIPKTMMTDLKRAKAVCRVTSQECVAKGALSWSSWSNNSNGFSSIDFKIDIFQNLSFGLIRKGYIFEFYFAFWRNKLQSIGQIFNFQGFLHQVKHIFHIDKSILDHSMGKKATYLIGVIHDLVLAISKSFGFLFFVQEKFYCRVLKFH